ncbi:MAG: hypothetical protein V8S82_04715 [Eubacteriales bacterium]
MVYSVDQRDIRNLGTIFDDEGCEAPTQVTTFLEESYDVLVNGNDRVHGIPVLIQENAAEETENGYIIKEEKTSVTLSACGMLQSEIARLKQSSV